MKKPLLKVILLRSALVVAACAVVYFGYLLVGIYLSPVPVPPAIPAKKSVTFDPALDVSKQPTFTQLQSLGAVNVSSTNLGRDNPFLPVVTSTLTSSAPPSSVTNQTEVVTATTTTAETGAATSTTATSSVNGF